MKKIIDDRGRLFGFVSIIDVIVLIAVVVLAVTTLTKFSIQDSPIITTSTVPVHYTVRVHTVRLMTADMFRPGDSLFNESGSYIGTIISIDVADAEVIETLADGTFVVARAFERYDVILTVEAQCSFSNGRYYADRFFELNANSEHRLNTKYIATTGTITTITAR